MALELAAEPELLVAAAAEEVSSAALEVPAAAEVSV